MTDPTDLTRTIALTFAHLDGQLSPADAAELHALLSSDPAAAEAFVRVCYHDGLLLEAFRDTYRLAPELLEPEDTPVVRSRRPADPPRPLRRWPLALAAGLLLAVGVGAWLLTAAGEGTRMVRSLGSQWKSAVPPLGGELAPGRRVTQGEGLAEFRLPGDVRVTAEGRCDLTICPPGRVRLDTGTLSVDVPRTAVGFTVETPFGTIIDRGTWFRVQVVADSAGVEVYEGAVDLVPITDTTALTRLSAGQSARFDAHQVRPADPLKRVPPRSPFAGLVYSDRQIRPWSAPPLVLRPESAPEGMQLIPEQLGHTLTADLTVAAPRPGDLVPVESVPTMVLPRGTAVHVYLVQTGRGASEGQLTFDAPVVGLLLTSPQLAGSDGQVSPLRFDGWPAEGRGLEGLAAGDIKNSLRLSSNRLTLWLRRTTERPEQFRVLLAAGR